MTQSAILYVAGRLADLKICCERLVAKQQVYLACVLPPLQFAVNLPRGQTKRE